MPDERTFYAVDWWTYEEGGGNQAAVFVEGTDVDEVGVFVVGLHDAAETPGNFYCTPTRARLIAQALRDAADRADALAAEATPETKP